MFATISDFLITMSLEPNVADLRYFKLWILLDQIIWVWNIKGLQHRVLKILRFKYLILFQRLNSFVYRRRDLKNGILLHISWIILFEEEDFFCLIKLKNVETYQINPDILFYTTALSVQYHIPSQSSPLSWMCLDLPKMCGFFKMHNSLIEKMFE